MSRTPYEAFEEDADAFYRETGYMAPGKDRPAEMGGSDPDLIRYELWLTWKKLKNEHRKCAALEAEVARVTENLRIANGLLDVARDVAHEQTQRAEAADKRRVELLHEAFDYAGQIDDLRQRAEEAEQDARRYRVLRNRSAREDHCLHCGYDRLYLNVGKDLDAAVDAALTPQPEAKDE